jgi:hypothetical protein
LQKKWPDGVMHRQAIFISLKKARTKLAPRLEFTL